MTDPCSAPIKTCAMCSTDWPDLESFVTDPQLQIVGYQARFDRPNEGIVLVTHMRPGCRTTLGITVEQLRTLYSGPEHTRRMTGAAECKGLCLENGCLEDCEAPCQMAWVRRIIQFMRRHELPPECRQAQ